MSTHELSLVHRLYDITGAEPGSEAKAVADREVLAGLALKYSPRYYQNEAINRAEWLFSQPEERFTRKVDPLPRHALFNMATGAGKTLVMAANILQLAKLGCRRFLFIVNSGDLVEKTRLVLGDPAHTKYQFASPTVMLGGRQLTIRVSDRFERRVLDTDVIEVVCTTVQKLHSDMTNPRAGGFSLVDLAREQTVVLADEAHHLNAVTTGKVAGDAEKSWEEIVNTIRDARSDNWLLEYTATVPTESAAVEKYKGKTLCAYDFNRFRQDGWSKHVELLATSNSLSDIDRILVACTLSEWRRNVAAGNAFNLKPVVLVKHTGTIKQLDTLYGDFREALEGLTGEKLQSLAEAVAGDRLLDSAFACAVTADGAVELAKSIKLGFRHSWKGHSKDNLDKSAVSLINTLEDDGNPLRILFVVNKLVEGWDVLNLFDVVRVGQTKSNDASYTIAEAQLIGRGARYWPFPRAATEAPGKRIFPADDERSRAFETLHYHSINASGYLTQLKRELQKSGLTAPAGSKAVLIEMKNEFARNVLPRGRVFSNTFITSPLMFSSLAEAGAPTRIELAVALGTAVRLQVDAGDNESLAVTTLDIELLELGSSVVRAALRVGAPKGFVGLRNFCAGISSLDDFLFGKDWLGALTLNLVCSHPAGFKVDRELVRRLPPAERYAFALRAIQTVWLSLARLEVARAGATKELTPRPMASVFMTSYEVHVEPTADPSGSGHSIARVNDDALRVDVNEASWYPYNDNVGTRDEKALIRWFANRETEIRDLVGDFYLLRNEGRLALYDPHTGARFNPDFILLTERGGWSAGVQLFLEPKGSHIADGDAWKQELLTAVGAEMFVDGPGWLVAGAPFFNEEAPRAATETIMWYLKTWAETSPYRP